MMLTSIFQRLLGCSHKRLTRPITPARKPGVPSGETSVVCLDCGRQFAYDWNHMRVGKVIPPSHDSGVIHPDMPGTAKTKVKYALLGSAIPLAVALGGALVNKNRNRTAAKPEEASAESPIPGTEPDRYIALPHGGPGARFAIRELIDYIEKSGRNYIIGGAVDCALVDHPRPASLDYWLRENFARNKETKQATTEVIVQLMATGLFEPAEDLRCPDTHEKTYGLVLKG